MFIKGLVIAFCIICISSTAEIYIVFSIYFECFYYFVIIKSYLFFCWYICIDLLISELIYWFLEWLLVGPYVGLELLPINSNPSNKWHRRTWIFPDPTHHYHNSASCWCEFVTDEGSHFTDSGRGSRRRVILSDAVEWLMEPVGGRLRDGLASLRGITHAGELLHQRRV